MTITAEYIARVLDGRSVRGTYWSAHCPVHGDRHPSLIIREDGAGKVRFECKAHACAEQDIINELVRMNAWNESLRCVRWVPRTDCADKTEYDAARSDYAIALWEKCIPIEGTLAEKYLATRGLTAPDLPTLRFHPAMWHSDARQTFPCMVAQVINYKYEHVAIHRTFLAADGSGKANLPKDQQRKSLGPCRGNFIPLAVSADPLLLAEGIETVLSGLRLKPGYAAISAVAAGGLETIKLPPDADDIVILEDGDAAGRKSARAGALRLMGLGRKVKIAHAPDGQDFNDLLLGRAA